MILVSEPEARLIVSSTEVDGRETTLVVPELERSRVEYFKCLVDEGAQFKEHAVVLWEGPIESNPDAQLVVRALAAARPTTVTLLDPEGRCFAFTGEQASPEGRAAALVVRHLSRLDEENVLSAGGYRLHRQGQFYVCTPDGE